MGTFTDVFERKEVKYRLNASQYAALLQALEGRMAPDAYGNTRIVSLYLDTPERLLVERSLDKPVYKEKLRLRSYGMPTEDDRVYIEIKKKFCGIVYKRRVGLSYAAARAYLGGLCYEQACKQYPLPDPLMAQESLAPRSVQIAREIDQFVMSYQPLQASMIIDCMRVAYAPLACLEAVAGETAPEAEDDLRITFDASIEYRDLFATEASSLSAASLLSSGEAVMEIKSAGPFPLWLVRALDECRAYPSSFSKYGEAYKRSTAGRVVERAESVAPSARAARGRARTQVQSDSKAVPALRRSFLAGAQVNFAVKPASSQLMRESSRLAATEAAECLAAGSVDVRPRRFKAPAHAMKKGGRCA